MVVEAEGGDGWFGCIFVRWQKLLLLVFLSINCSAFEEHLVIVAAFVFTNVSEECLTACKQFY